MVAPSERMQTRVSSPQGDVRNNFTKPCTMSMTLQLRRLSKDHSSVGIAFDLGVERQTIQRCFINRRKQRQIRNDGSSDIFRVLAAPVRQQNEFGEHNRLPLTRLAAA